MNGARHSHIEGYMQRHRDFHNASAGFVVATLGLLLLHMLLN